MSKLNNIKLIWNYILKIKKQLILKKKWLNKDKKNWKRYNSTILQKEKKNKNMKII